jgi:tripartite-type tricarboxylate transporter receptor subunit TctC
VPFKSAAAAYPDAITGTITMLIDSLPSAMQHLKAGTMRPLAMLSAARDPAMPDVPTIAEAGFPEAVLVFWSGLHGPAGMPGPVVQRLADTLGRTLQTPEIRERFAALGALPLPMSGKELATRIRTGRERLGKVIKAAGIQPE